MLVSAFVLKIADQPWKWLKGLSSSQQQDCSFWVVLEDTRPAFFLFWGGCQQRSWIRSVTNEQALHLNLRW